MSQCAYVVPRSNELSEIITKAAVRAERSIGQMGSELPFPLRKTVALPWRNISPLSATEPANVLVMFCLQLVFPAEQGWCGAKERLPFQEWRCRG